MTTTTITRFVLALILTALATAANAEIVKVETAAGPIQVSSTIAPRMKAFVDELVARGFKGHIGCYARGGHVSGSRHYSGNACDFEQVKPRYAYPHPMLRHVADLARKHGLRDGCTFRDCGHIDDGHQLARTRSKPRSDVQIAAVDRHHTN